ncbi:unnamed protein product [Scytosiphon promiscuus]
MADHEDLLPEYYSITGSWVLDLFRSDTFESYLRCLSIAEPAIQAQVAGERAFQSRNVIALDESTLAIHKDTAVHRFTETFQLGRERLTPRRTISGNVGRGANQATASLAAGGQLDGYVVATTTIGPGGSPSQETVEVRQLIDGGLAHTQQINVQNLATGGQCVVTRTWVRVPMTQEDRIRLLNE